MVNTQNKHKLPDKDFKTASRNFRSSDWANVRHGLLRNTEGTLKGRLGTVGGPPSTPRKSASFVCENFSMNAGSRCRP